MWIHRLSEIDSIKRTALCDYCGSVKITRKGDGYRCGSAAYAWNIRRKYGENASRRPKSCEVCESTVRIVFDHSHISGKFRGWLCNACNVALGHVNDNPEILRKLALYLEDRKGTL